MLGENEPTFLNDFEELYPYLDYRVEDEDGKAGDKKHGKIRNQPDG